MSKPIRVGITHGDINGIGYEIIIKALSDERIPELFTPVIFGSAKLVGYYRKVLEIDDFNYNTVNSPEDISDRKVNVVNISQEEFKVQMGEPTEESGRAALMALEAACEALKAGQIDVLVTAPINKHAIHGDEFNFPGHTEYLAERLGSDGGNSPLMILYNDDLRVALATTHLPLRNVADAISIDSLKEKIRLLDNSMRKDFGIERPTIAVLSLNPHNGDNGLLGREEQEIIEPAIAACAEQGLLVFGPFPADGFFGTGAYKKYDAVLAMFHDQGLVPFKTIAGTDGVNFTAGLPYIRTSPDHGTGYDIVGRNIADASSLRKAIYEAIDIYRRRLNWLEARRNPLKKQYNERGADKTIDLTKDEPEL